MSDGYSGKTGDVLARDANGTDSVIEEWILLSIEEDEAYLCRLGVNEDGSFCTTNVLIVVDVGELDEFRATGLKVHL